MYADRVKQSVTSPGSGTVTLPGAASTGYQTFLNAFGSGSTLVSYCIADQAGNSWEVGTGTYNGTANTLTRSSVFASSNSNSLVNFASGVQDVFCTAPARYLDVFTATNQGTVPASGGGNNFLRSDGVWASPAASMAMDGADGEDGMPGPAGVAGSSGATGATGATGAAGSVGMPGEDGIDGDIGPPGLAGSTGQTGAAGARGQIGPAGEDGSDAESFLIGIPTPQAAGSTTQIQYNNAGAFGASANFTYTSGTNTLTTGNITGSATSMIIQPRAVTSGNGGYLELNTRSGASTNSNGGDLNFNLGAGYGTGSGGNFVLLTGNVSSDNGAVFIINGATPGVGGAVVVGSGYAGTGAGGDYQFYLGGGALDDGNMYFQDPTGSNFIWCKTDGSGGAQQIGFFNATPVVQQASAPVATNLANAITLVNALRTALLNLGLIV